MYLPVYDIDDAVVVEADRAAVWKALLRADLFAVKRTHRRQRRGTQRPCRSQLEGAGIAAPDGGHEYCPRCNRPPPASDAAIGRTPLRVSKFQG